MLILYKYIRKELHGKIKRLLMVVVMIGLDFLCKKKKISKIKKKNNICISVFCYENKLVFPIYVSDQKFENSMDLLLLTDGDKLHYYVCINDFNRYMFHKTKNKSKIYFAKVASSVLVENMCWQSTKKSV